MKNSQPDIVDPLDRLLAVSLSAQPEARPITNLAERAIERARVLDLLAAQQRRGLLIHRWRLRIVYCAAALLIGLLVLFGGNRLLSERRLITSTDEMVSATESVAPTSGTYVLWLGGLLFICTLAGLATENAISPHRPSLV